jgi:hypothetical protein
MPADAQYDEVHEKVKIKVDEPYGCRNRPDLSGGYWVKERVYLKGDGGRYELLDKFIKFDNSPKCRSFHLWDTDPRCSGCTTSRDVDYALRMKGMK